jgi:TetR/AcrR family transcriptional regulator
MPPLAAPRPLETGSRDRLLAAAAAEFAARGFAGANVDRIARAARVNKAMIYYHFKSKAALYREILRDMFEAVGSRVREVAASDASHEEKIRRFIEAIAAEAEARPHFPPIWIRELAEGSTHVDEQTLRYARSVLETLAGMLEAGRRAGRFVQVNPLLVHAGIIAPLMFFLATGALRRKLDAAGVKAVRELDRDRVIAHIERVTLALVEGRL